MTIAVSATGGAKAKMLPILLSLAAIHGLLSGLSWPASYSLTHMIIDYHFGFGKRGLIGTVIGLIDHAPYHYLTLSIMAFAVMAAWLLLLCWIASPMALRDGGIGAALLLFLLSLGFSVLVDDVGRGEHFGLLLMLPCLLLPAAGWGLILRVLLMTAAILAHEANFLIFVPLAAYDVWLGTEARPKFRPILNAVSVLLPLGLLTLWLGNVRTGCDGAAELTYLQRMAADFVIHPVPPGTLCNDGVVNLHLTLHALWEQPRYAIMVPLALLLSAPSAAFNLHILDRIARRPVSAIAGIAASLSPLALLLVGVDAVRFVTLIQNTSLIALISTARRLGLPPGDTLPSSGRSTALVVGLAVFELGSAIPLNDGTMPIPFPYSALLQRLIAVMSGTAPFVAHI